MVLISESISGCQKVERFVNYLGGSFVCGLGHICVLPTRRWSGQPLNVLLWRDFQKDSLGLYSPGHRTDRLWLDHVETWREQSGSGGLGQQLSRLSPRQQVENLGLLITISEVKEPFRREVLTLQPTYIGCYKPCPLLLIELSWAMTDGLWYTKHGIDCFVQHKPHYTFTFETKVNNLTVRDKSKSCAQFRLILQWHCDIYSTVQLDTTLQIIII